MKYIKNYSFIFFLFAFIDGFYSIGLNPHDPGLKNHTSKNSASGTSVAMISSSFNAEREILQCYYLSEKKVNNKKLSWLGYMLSLKMDSYGHLRGGNDGKCISYVFKNGETIINTLKEDAKTKKCSDTVLTGVPLTSFTNYAWEAGDELKKTDPDDRNIFTFLNNKKVAFKSVNTDIYPYLQYTGAGADLIEFIRGKKVSNSRDRTITDSDGTNEWKLGDIIHSSPTVVGNPSEQYHLRYGDKTYGKFFDKYKNNPREKVAYIGANDGMLHAICIDPVGCKTGVDAGQELWAFIPFNLLPHLKWLKDPDYAHVYYVDLKAKVTDIKIAGKWKTILICGMGFGGGRTNNFRSSYFALDITDPKEPAVLWESRVANTGFSLSYPAIAHVDDKWFVIAGSGLITSKSDGINNTNRYKSKSISENYIYVFNAATGVILKRFLTNPAGFNSSPLAIDVDLKTEYNKDGDIRYNTEVIYIGAAYLADSKSKTPGTLTKPVWRGGIYRLSLNGDTNPGNWKMSTFFKNDINDIVYPVTAQPVAGFDENKNLWIYFGTGRLFSKQDKEDAIGKNRFYGIKEPCVTNKQWDTNCDIADHLVTSDLYNTTDIEITDINKTTGGDTVTNAGKDKNWNALLTSASTRKGWYYNLSSGKAGDIGSESVSVKPVAVAGLILFITSTPDAEIYGSGGTSKLYALYYKTGTAYMSETLKDPTNKNVSAPTIVRKSIDLGNGFASSPSIIAKGTNLGILVQKSTGELVIVNSPVVIKKSRVKAWKSF